jgi:Flp pilus assembly protein TadB
MLYMLSTILLAATLPIVVRSGLGGRRLTRLGASFPTVQKPSPVVAAED